MSKMMRSGVLKCALPMILALSAARADSGLGSGMFGLATGQSARLSALNLGSRSSGPGSGCAVTMQLLDADGKVLVESSKTISVGKSAVLDVTRNQIPGKDLRAEIRAVLLFGYSGGAPAGPEARQQYDCNIVPGIQLFDSTTGKTTVVIPEFKPLPSPDLRSVAGARGQK